ncbi:MAG: hypothetical protein ACRD0P_06730, partial [Stackebrandtia sp.]
MVGPSRSARPWWLAAGGLVVVAAVVAVPSFAKPSPARAGLAAGAYLADSCPVKELDAKGSWEDATQAISSDGKWMAGAAADSGLLNLWHDGDDVKVTVPNADRVEVRDITDDGAVLGVSFNGSDDELESGERPTAAWVYGDGDFRELEDESGSDALDVRSITDSGTIYGESLSGEPLSDDPDEP